MSKIGLVHIPGFLANRDNCVELHTDPYLSDMVSQYSADIRKSCTGSQKKGLGILEDITNDVVCQIIEFQTQQNIKKVILHGNSLGGKISTNIVLHPSMEHKVSGLILDCSAGLGENLQAGNGTVWSLMNRIGNLSTKRDQHDMVKLIISIFINIPLEKIPEWLIKQTLDLIFIQNKENGKYDGTNRIQLMNFMKLGNIFKKDDLNIQMEEQTKQQLQEIKQKEIPSLVIAGANDTVLPLEIAQEQRDLLGADFVIMKTGHTPHIEDKNGFVQYIIQWIKKNNI